MAEKRVQKRIAAILAADVVGYPIPAEERERSLRQGSCIEYPQRIRSDRETATEHSRH